MQAARTVRAPNHVHAAGTTVIRSLSAALSLSTLSFVALTMVAASCTQLPKPPGGEVRSSGSALMDQRSPLEVVVAPVEGANAAGGNGAVPTEDLRAGFQQALIARRYSPIALRYVDKKVVEASYSAGALSEQAVFQTKVTRFDTALFDTNGAIHVALTVKMVDAADGTVLWTGSVDRRYDFSANKDQYATSSARMRAACEYITAEVLEALPARNPMPGYATN